MSQQTILVVEDSDDIRLLLKMALEMKGYRVVEAADGRQAIERAVKEGPQLILMDLSMPLMDGWEATRKLRQLEQFRETPIVAVSAHGSGMMRAAAIQAGCDAVFQKPVDNHAMDRILSEYLVIH